MIKTTKQNISDLKKYIIFIKQDIKWYKKEWLKPSVKQDKDYLAEIMTEINQDQTELELAQQELEWLEAIDE